MSTEREFARSCRSAQNWPCIRNKETDKDTQTFSILYNILAVHPTAYGARFLLAPAKLGSRACRTRSVAPATVSCEFSDGACHPFAAAYTDGARSAVLRVRAALANRLFTCGWAWPARWPIRPILGSWGSKVHKKWEIPCLGRR